MSTLRISNIEAKSVPASATIDEKVKITNSSGDPLVFIDGKTSGITTVGINTTDPNITFDANSNVVVTGIITATKFSGQFEPTSVGIADSIFHTGDTDTAIRFKLDDTIRFETGGAPRLILNSGNIIQQSGTFFVKNATSDSNGLKLSQESGDESRIFNHYSGALTFGTANTERARIDSSGRLLVGTDSNRVTRLATNSFSPKMQLEDDTEAAFSMSRFINSAGPPRLVLQKARGTGASPVIVQNNDDIGQILFSGWDGDTFTNGAEIIAEVDGTPGDDVMPGRLIFKTNTGGTTNTERLRIQSDGNVVIGYISANAKLQVNSGASTAVGNATNPAFQIGDTTNYRFAIHTTNAQAIIANKNGDDGIAFHTKTANSGSFGEACRITSAGNLAFTSGNGIDFSATSDASGMTKELLDDYEEGSWTPTYDTSGSSGSITVSSYSLQYGKYVKIGKMVFVEGVLRANVTNNSNGTYDIGGLPFTIANTTNASGMIHGKEQSSWNDAPDHFSPIPNTTRARARNGLTVGASSYVNGNTSGFNSGSSNNNRVYIVGSYRAEG